MIWTAPPPRKLLRRDQGIAAGNGIEITELSTHLQGQLVAVHPAYDTQFAMASPPPPCAAIRRRAEWAADQVKKALSASSNLGLTAQATFSGALAWPYLYPWPQRPAGLVEEAFDELARRWTLLNHADDCGVDPVLRDSPRRRPARRRLSYEMFLDRVNGAARANMLYPATSRRG